MSYSCITFLGNIIDWQSFPGEKSITYRSIAIFWLFALARIQEVFWENEAEVQVYKGKLWIRAVRTAHLLCRFFSKCAVLTSTSLET